MLAEAFDNVPAVVAAAGGGGGGEILESTEVSVTSCVVLRRALDASDGACNGWQQCVASCACCRHSLDAMWLACR